MKFYTLAEDIVKFYSPNFVRILATLNKPVEVKVDVKFQLSLN